MARAILQSLGWVRVRILIPCTREAHSLPTLAYGEKDARAGAVGAKRGPRTKQRKSSVPREGEGSLGGAGWESERTVCTTLAIAGRRPRNFG